MSAITINSISDTEFVVTLADGRQETWFGFDKANTEETKNYVRRKYSQPSRLVTNDSDEEPLLMPVFNYAKEGVEQYTASVPSLPISEYVDPLIGNADPREEPLTTPDWSEHYKR